MNRRRLKGVAMITAGDLMACFLGILFMVLQMQMKKLEAEKAVVHEDREKAALEVATAAKDKAQLEVEIDALSKKKWKLVTSQWQLGGGKVEKPDISLYCLKDGVFADPRSGQALTDEALKSWVAAQPESAKILYLYVENGGNDSLLRAQSALHGSAYTSYSLMTLPSGLDPRL